MLPPCDKPAHTTATCALCKALCMHVMQVRSAARALGLAHPMLTPLVARQPEMLEMPPERLGTRAVQVRHGRGSLWNRSSYISSPSYVSVSLF